MAMKATALAEHKRAPGSNHTHQEPTEATMAWQARPTVNANTARHRVGIPERPQKHLQELRQLNRSSPLSACSNTAPQLADWLGG
eukprot:7601855-Alexandrium_andersonii.AAC.1